MQLKFYARGDMLVTRPDVPPMVGSPPQYVGRKFVPRSGDTPASNPATKEGTSVNSESKAGRRLSKVCRRDGTIWPADEATAQFCGVTFRELRYQDNEWVEAPQKIADSPKREKKSATFSVAEME